VSPARQAAAPGAIGFDLGETLLTYAGTPLNWAALYPDALARVAAACGAAPAPADLDRAIQRLRQANTRLHPRAREIRAEELFAGLLADWGRPADAAETRRGLEAFFGFFQRRMQPYPDTAPALAALRARGLRLGVLTDVPYGMPREFVERDLAGAGLTACLDTLLTSGEVGWRKPDPAGFHALAARLEAAASTLWYVGNEEKDIRGALAAGLTAVLIDRDRQRPAWGQHHTVSDLRALPELVETTVASA
jgi:putative hydrolase of the HAD superfamily